MLTVGKLYQPSRSKVKEMGKTDIAAVRKADGGTLCRIDANIFFLVLSCNKFSNSHWCLVEILIGSKVGYLHVMDADNWEEVIA